MVPVAVGRRHGGIYFDSTDGGRYANHSNYSVYCVGGENTDHSLRNHFSRYHARCCTATLIITPSVFHNTV